jgi:leader peptidase (prepilin peptidase)/N-methyltransferase
MPWTTAAALIPVVYLAAVTPALVVTDLRERRLPNRVTVPGIAIGVVAAGLQWSWIPLVAGLAYGGALWLLGVRGGIGMGDVKLATLLGLAAGPATPVAAASAFLLGGVAASVALVRRGRGVRIPFGPWLLAGYWVTVMAESTAGISP